MAWTQADIDALKTALKSGVLTVRYKDRQKTYRSLAEMTELLRMMENEVQGPGQNVSYVEFARD